MPGELFSAQVSNRIAAFSMCAAKSLFENRSRPSLVDVLA